jgi:hypothetical protein
MTFSIKAEHFYSECLMYHLYAKCHFAECCNAINFDWKKCFTFKAMKIFRVIFFNIKTPAKLYVVKDTSKIPPKEDIRTNVTDFFVQIEPCCPNI